MEKKQIRCAIYTRKSTEEGLEQSFNSLDAQRDSCEAYIKSQTHEGWKILTKHYDDGGYSGGTMNRPAFQELLKDIRVLKTHLTESFIYLMSINARCLRENTNRQFLMQVKKLY